MDPFAILDQLRADYPKMSAAALILGGCGIGWAIAWLFFKQRLTHHKEVVDHYKDVIGGKFGLLENRTEPPQSSSSFNVEKSKEPPEQSKIALPQNSFTITPKHLMVSAVFRPRL
jgi:hypothetical protein